METKFNPRGRKFTGPIKTSRMTKTAVFELERRTYIPKYERYEKRRTRIKVHVPEGITIDDGDVVTIQETRPISKTKTFIIVENHTKAGSLKTRKEKKADSAKKTTAKKSTAKKAEEKKQEKADEPSEKSESKESE